MTSWFKNSKVDIPLLNEAKFLWELFFLGSPGPFGAFLLKHISPLKYLFGAWVKHWRAFLAHSARLLSKQLLRTSFQGYRVWALIIFVFIFSWTAVVGPLVRYYALCEWLYMKERCHWDGCYTKVSPLVFTVYYSLKWQSRAIVKKRWFGIPNW